MAEHGTLKLRRFLDARPLPGFVSDLQSPWLLATNPQFRDLIGYSTSELLRMRMDDLRPEEDVPLMLNTLHNGVHEAVIRWRYRTKDGLLVWVRLKFRNMRYIAPGRRVQHVRFCVITDAATRDTGLRPEFRGIDVSSLGDNYVG